MAALVVVGAVGAVPLGAQAAEPGEHVPAVCEVPLQGSADAGCQPPPPPPPPPEWPPRPPSGLTITEVGSTYVKLRFVDRSTNEEGWHVERRQWPSGSFTRVYSTPRDHRDGRPATIGATIVLRAPKSGPLDCFRVKASPRPEAAATPQVCVGPTRRTSFNFEVQDPVNVPESQRYFYNAFTDVHSMWVEPTDVSATDSNPRTELRWHNEYTTGQHLWDANVYVEPGSAHVTIMQIFRTGQPGGIPTALRLSVDPRDNGTLRRHAWTSSRDLLSGAWGGYFNLKVLHNADTRQIHVFVGNVLTDTTTDAGRVRHHFKNGAYLGGDGRALARFHNLRYWTT